MRKCFEKITNKRIYVKNIYKYEKRFLYTELKRYLESKNALVISGIRQVGKTILMKHLLD